jgi:hypothetical protein
MPININAKRLLVGIAASGVQDPVLCAAIVRSVPHRQLVGVVCNIGKARPAMGWIAVAQHAGLSYRAYVADPDSDAPDVEAAELQLCVARRLRDPKVDAVMLVGLVAAPGPIARAVHDSGRPLVLAVRADLAERARRCADAVIVLEEYARAAGVE